MDITRLLSDQRRYFQSGATLPIRFRVEMLKKLYDGIKRYENEIVAAVQADLGRSDYESFMCEIGMSLSEIRYLLRHIGTLAGKRRVSTPLAQFPSVSYQQATPYGNTLIMSPWNYPFLLTVDPLAEAIAAGNTAIVKPSGYAPKTSALLKKLISELFPPEYIAVVVGGRAENQTLLDQKFDFIFFTGSQSVGKEVLRHAAEYLTPVVLELGGKSPCIVDDTVKIQLAAKRIVFGKFLNCGQTCVAPDYVLCHEGIRQPLVKAICEEIRLQYGEEPLANPDYGRIVNEKHFDRLCGLMMSDKTVFGGKVDRSALKISPTVMDRVTWEDRVMGEEIFGPILPILTFERFEEVFPILEEQPKPLALYLFSQDRERIRAVTERCRYGGGCVNDTIIHLATCEMGFGGVGESGMGSYHGKVGFDAFSHIKSMVEKKTWLDLPMRYQPYRRERYGKLLRHFLK